MGKKPKGSTWRILSGRLPKGSSPCSNLCVLGWLIDMKKRYSTSWGRTDLSCFWIRKISPTSCFSCTSCRDVETKSQRSMTEHPHHCTQWRTTIRFLDLCCDSCLPLHFHHKDEKQSSPSEKYTHSTEEGPPHPTGGRLFLWTVRTRWEDSRVVARPDGCTHTRKSIHSIKKLPYFS